MTSPVGNTTKAHVSWRIRPHSHGAVVDLTATVVAAGPIDRLLLACGGRRWLEARFREVLDRRARELEPRPIGGDEWVAREMVGDRPPADDLGTAWPTASA